MTAKDYLTALKVIREIQRKQAYCSGRTEPYLAETLKEIEMYCPLDFSKSGGIHGRNRLMGNSLLDIIVFGRDAGKAAAAKAKTITLGTPNLDHIYQYADMLKEAGCTEEGVSPLLLPHYARHER